MLHWSQKYQVTINKKLTMVGLILKIVINYKNSVSFSGINYDKRKKVLLKLTEQPNVWYTMIYKNKGVV